MRLAIVHDFLLSYGGAERVLEHVHELWPKAPVYTLRYDAEKMHHKMDGWDIRSSNMDRMPVVGKSAHALAMPFYPYAIEQFDLSDYDVVLSLSSVFAHGVITQPETTHICYYHTPARFLWDYHFQYLKEKGWDRGVKGAAARRILHQLRQWDFLASKRPDVRLANSKTVQKRLSKFYHQDSEVIYPGIDFSRSTFHVTRRPEASGPEARSTSDYYVTISRLTAPKRIELAVEACTKLNRPLHVIGVGDQLEYLQSIAGPSVSFLGFLPDESVQHELEHCKALLWPNIDDFGLVPVEAMACGRPVVAFNQDGATETVIDGQTGVLFDNQTAEGLIAGIKRLDEIEDKLDPKKIQAHAQQFSKEAFQKKIKEVVEKAQP